MKILAVDVGTGTQDIFLYDSRVEIENGYKLVLPSPTMMIHRRIKLATRRKVPLLLTGFIMGGGPSQWAAVDHVRAGLPVFATPEAALTFNDDLSAVGKMGIHIISQDETRALPADTERLEMRDFDFEAIRTVLVNFGISLDDLAAVAVAVFDHGNAPPHISDRQFRFDYLDQRLRAANRLSAFAYPAGQIPPMMTRLQAVADSSPDLPAPLLVMDTAPAAVLGATFDPQVRSRERVMIANIGNFHSLAFRLGPGGIEGVFEHHTGEIDPAQMETLLRKLAGSTLKHEDVFNHAGHGALMYTAEPLPLDRPDFNVVVTGPRRSLLRSSALRPYFAVPFGDMMVAGCFGLLAAAADLLPELRETIRASLLGEVPGSPPWESEA